MESERIACPMCGWLRPVKFGVDRKTGEPREVRFDKVDVTTAPMWRKEKLTGAGRGSKDARIELLDSKTLAELPADMKDQVRRQCQKILNEIGEVLDGRPAPAPRSRPRRGKAKTD